MKIVKRIALAVVILLVVILVGGIMFFGSIVRKGVETAGPAILGVPVKLAGVSVHPFRGSVVITGLEVGNPEGYKSDFLFKLGRLEAQVDLSTLTKDVVVVKKIEIYNPEISYEQGLTGNNISSLLALLKKEESAEAKTPDPKEEPAAAAKKAKKVVIELFVLDEAKVNVSAKVIGDKQITVPMPSIELKDIGKEKDGASMVEVITRVVQAIAGGLTDVVAAAFKGAGQAVGAVVDVAGDGVSAVGDAAGKVGGAAADGVKSVKDGILGIFSKEEAPAK